MSRLYYITSYLLLGLGITLASFFIGCGSGDSGRENSETQYPPIEPGKGRIILNFASVPEKITTRKIIDNFLIGIGTTDSMEGCVSTSVLKDFRISGVNYFLPFTSWASIEKEEGYYFGDPCPGSFIFTLKQSGAVLNGHCLIFLMDASWLIPSFAFGRSFDKQKEMIENFVKATVNRFPEIEIWTLNEPIAANCFGWSREQIYDVFVSASRWIHEVNTEAKVMINMIPIQCNWSGLDYDPNEVLDDLINRGLEADIIGIELYYWWAGMKDQDENGYPMLYWISERLNLFRGYNLPIIFSEVGVPGILDGREQFYEQADWMEAFFRFCHDDEDVIGATWYFVRDDPFMPYAGLTNYDYTYRPIAERLIEIANEWNPSTTHDLNGQKYLDLDPGEYDVIINQQIFRVTVIEGLAVFPY